MKADCEGFINKGHRISINNNKYVHSKSAIKTKTHKQICKNNVQKTKSG